MYRTGGKDYYPLALATVPVVHENVRPAVHALYTGLYSERERERERGLFHMRPDEC
jgi:hypothetical protein